MILLAPESSQTVSVSQNLVLGKQSYSDVAYFEGSLANIGIWNRALSASEIESIYWRGQYADLKGTELTNLVSWYNLSADANDSTGTNNGTNNGATFLTDAYSASSPFLPRIQDKATPKGAVALASGSTSFDGNDDYISIADSDSLSFGDGSTDSALTFSAWVKANDVTSFYIIAKGIYNTSGEYRLFINSSNKLIARFMDESVNSTYIGREYSTGVESYEGKWTHIATTYDGSSNNSGVKIYINGSRVDNADNVAIAVAVAPNILKAVPPNKNAVPVTTANVIIKAVTAAFTALAIRYSPHR